MYENYEIYTSTKKIFYLSDLQVLSTAVSYFMLLRSFNSD